MREARTRTGVGKDMQGERRGRRGMVRDEEKGEGKEVIGLFKCRKGCAKRRMSFLTYINEDERVGKRYMR